MTFSAPFGRIVRPSLGPALSTGGPWWLSGGIAAANCIVAYQPKGAADLAASYVNLANPGTYNAAPGVAPTFAAATGWTFDGINQYLDTGLDGNNNQSWVIRYSDAVASLKPAFGMSDGTAVRINFYPKYSATQYFRCSGDYNRSAPADFAAAIAACTKDAAYWNGYSIGSVTGDYTGTSTVNILIAALGGVGISCWPGKIQAFAIYDITLSAAQVLALYTAMAAL